MAKEKVEFAIKKEVLNDGTEQLTPVFRRKRLFIQDNWERIACIYGKFTLMELDFVPSLTYEDCVGHIQGYKEVLRTKVANQVATEELHLLESSELNTRAINIESPK
jgi:hypothetical protein